MCNISKTSRQVVLTKDIGNYPAFKNVDGVTLATSMFEQIKELGAEIKFEEVISCNLTSKEKVVKTNKGEYTAKTVYVSTGAYVKPLQVENEKKFINKGISYCATCDGALFKGKDVAIVGGGNVSIEDCIYLSNIAKTVYLIHRRDTFTADEISVQKVRELEKEGIVKFVLNSEVVGICGEDKLESIVVHNKITDTTSAIDVSALFIAIGRKPDTGFMLGIELDEKGYIKVNDQKQTNISGVFAGGDVSNGILKQIVTACSDGAIGASSIVKYLAQNK